LQQADEGDEDERYTPLKLWIKQTTGHHPTTGDIDLSYRQLSSESDKESDSAEGTVGLLTSFNNTTPNNGTATGNQSLTPSTTTVGIFTIQTTQATNRTATGNHTPTPLKSTAGRLTPHFPTQPTQYPTPSTRQTSDYKHGRRTNQVQSTPHPSSLGNEGKTQPTGWTNMNYWQTTTDGRTQTNEQTSVFTSKD